MVNRSGEVLSYDAYVDDRRHTDRRSGQERRGRERRTGTALHCPVCSHAVSPESTATISVDSGSITIHMHCALSLMHALIDHLAYGTAGVQRPEETAGPDPHLTPREQEIVGYLVRGQRDREIGEHLGIAEKTVKVHAGKIRKKLGARTRAEAAVRAVALGLDRQGHQDRGETGRT